MIKKALEGVPVSKETFAIGVIKKAGAGNNHSNNKITWENFGIGSTRVF
ncbi:MAG: hypothetical protein PHW56_08985 [Methanosarcinaceae archaeon]|nr:hypothetical protein [Methanosarcinaceae archaeon]